jgi:hypothetical protein
MADQSVWLRALQESLTVMSGRKTPARGNWLSFRRKSEFEIICEDVERAMKQAGSDLADPEWQTAKSLMKAVYDRTCEAVERGYNFYQFTLGSPNFLNTLSRLVPSSEVQDGLKLWSRKLGWESADLVDWTTISLERPSSTARALAHRKEQYTMRLQGLWAARQRDRQAEQFGYPVLRPVRERMM